MNRRQAILLIAMEALLLLTAGWSLQYMLSGKAAATAAQDDLRDGVAMMGQIEQLGRQPTLATDREKLSTETTGLIESAAVDAGIKPESLRRISPGTSRYLGASAYKEKPTDVTLQAVTLKQAVAFASAASLAQAGLNVESIRLSLPREAGAVANLWNVELVLTYLVYDPQERK